MEQEYKFTVKLSNSITSSESLISSSIIPLTLPSIGIINNVSCEPNTKTLFINSSYQKKSYKNKSMNPLKLFIKILPYPGNNSFVMNNDEWFKLDEKNQRIQIIHKPKNINNNDEMCIFEQLIVSSINLGNEYSIFMEAENSVGKNVINIDKSYKYIPVRKPPKPMIEYVNTDSSQWTMSIHFRADGFDDNDCRAWFELELIDPNIYNKTNININNTNTDEKNDENDESLLNEMMKELIYDDDEDDYDIKPQIVTPQSPKVSDRENTFLSSLDNEIKNVLNKKHKSSPIVLSPLFAGQQYILRIKCVNNQGVTLSDIHEPIILEVEPTIPIFTRKRALDSMVLLKYECPNYNWYRGYQPKYEIKAIPHHKQAAITTQTQVRIDSLRNGWAYVFKVRAKNKFGQSDWSNAIRLTPLKKPDKPEALYTVSGDSCITVFWFSFDNMEEQSINGKFTVISDPPTIQQTATSKHKVEFQALDNNKFYRFKVIASNDNYRIESDWTKSVKPSAKKEKKQYKNEKNIIVDKIMSLRRKKINEKKKQEIKLRQEKRAENIERIKKAQMNEKENELQTRLTERENAQLTIQKGSVARRAAAFKKQSNNNDDTKKKSSKKTF